MCTTLKMSAYHATRRFVENRVFGPPPRGVRIRPETPNLLYIQGGIMERVQHYPRDFPKFDYIEQQLLDAYAAHPDTPRGDVTDSVMKRIFSAKFGGNEINDQHDAVDFISRRMNRWAAHVVVEFKYIPHMETYMRISKRELEDLMWHHEIHSYDTFVFCIKYAGPRVLNYSIYRPHFGRDQDAWNSFIRGIPIPEPEEREPDPDPEFDAFIDEIRKRQRGN